MTFVAHNQHELPFGVRIRPRMTLFEVEQKIKRHRILEPCPSRQTLIRMCDDGTFEGKLMRGRWEVYVDSFWQWAGYDEKQMAIAA
jgi:hypothetical protein